MTPETYRALSQRQKDFVVERYGHDPLYIGTQFAGSYRKESQQAAMKMGEMLRYLHPYSTLRVAKTCALDMNTQEVTTGTEVIGTVGRFPGGPDPQISQAFYLKDLHPFFACVHLKEQFPDSPIFAVDGIPDVFLIDYAEFKVSAKSFMTDSFFHIPLKHPSHQVPPWPPLAPGSALLGHTHNPSLSPHPSHYGRPQHIPRLHPESDVTECFILSSKELLYCVETACWINRSTALFEEIHFPKSGPGMPYPGIQAAKFLVEMPEVVLSIHFDLEAYFAGSQSTLEAANAVLDREDHFATPQMDLFWARLTSLNDSDLFFVLTHHAAYFEILRKSQFQPQMGVLDSRVLKSLGSLGC